MIRRRFMFLAGAVAVPVGARAQTGKVLRVGAVSGQPHSSEQWRAFLERMTALGHREGENFTFDFVQAGSLEAFQMGYQRYANGQVDIVLAPGPEIALKSALAVPGTAPIVMVAADYDPLARGYVKNLARPEGRLTGLMLQQLEATAKRIQLLKDTFPDLKTMTVLWDQPSAEQWQVTQKTAAELGIRIAGIELRNPPYDYEKALMEAPPEFRGTLVPLTSPFIFRDCEKIAAVARSHRSALVFSERDMAVEGGLMTYGPSFPALYARLADYVDRIARGAKPGELPIEPPAKLELVVNLKTARAIGIALPPKLLARADEVIR